MECLLCCSVFVRKNSFICDDLSSNIEMPQIIYGYLKGIIALFMLVYIFQVVVGPAAILNSTCNNLNMVAAYAFPSIFYDQHVLFPPFSIIYMKA